MVLHANNEPKKYEPPSPINILDGYKLCLRKPVHAPQAIKQIKAIPKFPKLINKEPKIKKIKDEKLPANPSNPSNQLIAFVKPAIHKTLNKYLA